MPPEPIRRAVTVREVADGLRKAWNRWPAEARESASPCRLCGAPRTQNEFETYRSLCEECWSVGHLPSFLTRWHPRAVKLARERLLGKKPQRPPALTKPRRTRNRRHYHHGLPIHA